MVQVQPRGDNSFRRLDMNEPPTAVGGIGIQVDQ